MQWIHITLSQLELVTKSEDLQAMNAFLHPAGLTICTWSKEIKQSSPNNQSTSLQTTCSHLQVAHFLDAVEAFAQQLDAIYPASFELSMNCHWELNQQQSSMSGPLEVKKHGANMPEKAGICQNIQWLMVPVWIPVLYYLLCYQSKGQSDVEMKYMHVELSVQHACIKISSSRER